MKSLRMDDTIGIGVYVGETVRDCIRKYGRKSILEILKYYDLDENILKMCHLRSLDKDNPEVDKKEQDWVQELLDTPIPVGETIVRTTTQDEECLDMYQQYENEMDCYDNPEDDDEFGPLWGPVSSYKPWINV
jgi:predicted metal-dependent TIM-barrel fold hydrolase